MGFFLVCLYVGVLLIRPQEWYEPIKGYELVNIVAIPTILIAFIEQSKSKGASFFTRSRFSQVMLGLFASVILSQLAGLRVQGAMFATTEFGKIAVLFYLVAILVNTPQRVKVMMWVLIGCAILLCYHTYLQVQTGFGFGNIPPYGSYEADDFRVIGSGIFSDPNDFAMLYIMAVPFVFSLMTSGTAVPGKLVLFCSLPPMMYVLYYTKSRGGLIGFCAMIAAYFWASTKNILFRLVGLVLLLTAIVVFGPERARETYVEGSASGRIMEWGLGIQMLKENPLFGFGYQRWPDYSGGMAAHNSAVNCFAELGLVGYACWFTLCLIVVKGVFRITKAVNQVDSRTRQLAKGLFAAQVGYLTSAFFLTRTYNPVLFFLLGLGVGLIRYVENQDPTTTAPVVAVSVRDLRQSAIIAVLSIPVIWVMIRIYWSVSGAS
jgi:putative inorganic carbon (hco3(-)) transporter